MPTTTTPYERGVVSNLIKAYSDLFEAERRRAEQQLRDYLREWNYAMGAQGMVGSGPWMEGVRRRVSDVLQHLYGTTGNLASQLLTSARGYREYETAAQQSIADVLSQTYGTRGLLGLFSDIMSTGATPRTIEEANIEAALRDLFYRLGLASKIAGGFGAPYATSKEIYEASSPFGYGLAGGLTAFATGLMDYLTRLRGS